MQHRKLRRYFRRGTLTQLGVFEAVARHSSFTRAAEELHMAQPTVSVQVKKLVETIGLPLLEMVGKRVRMTSAGHELYAACQDIFLKIAEIDDRLAQLRSPAGGSLRIAVSTTAEYFAPRLMAKFLECHPGVDFALAVLNREHLLNRLAANLDDLYIFSNPPEDAAIVMHTLLPNPMLVYARSDHALVKRKSIGFREVAAAPFLMRERGSGTRLVATQVFEANGITPNVRMELGSTEAIKQAILGGLGISILSRHTMGLGTQHAGLVALEVEGFPLWRWWYLVYPEGRRLSPPAQAFVDQFRSPGALTQFELAPTPASAETVPSLG